MKSGKSMKLKLQTSLAVIACLGILSVGATNVTIPTNAQNLAKTVDAEQIGGASNVTSTNELEQRNEAVAKAMAEGKIIPATTKDGSGQISIKLTKPALSYVSDVVYEQVPRRGYENTAMKMDIIRPQVNPGEQKVFPTVVFVTGGGFINANKDNYLQQRVELAEAGYVVASIEYRVAPTATMPQPLEDVKGAVRFLRANASKYNVDVNHIGLWGGSAGGYLVAMAGTTNGNKTFDKGDFLDQSSNVQAVVDAYGLSDLTKVGADYSKEVQELHKSSGATEALWVNGSGVFGGKDGGILADLPKAKAANPITYISQQTPPFLLLHGNKDVVVSPSQTKILHEALVKHGIESHRYVVNGASHGGVYWAQPEIMDLIIQFFDEHLK